ncbi:MAG: DUF4192 family protein [Microbacteriaceae bacterium]|nr:DUF4192 family protein [Microbacteriaceae bacterium]
MRSPRRLRTAADLLTAVPGILGYEPAESLVVLPLAGRYGGAVLRFDLPPAELHDDFAAGVVEHLLRFDDCDRIAVAAFTDAPLGLDEPPHRPLVDAIAALAADEGIEIACAALRGGDGWCEFRGAEAGTLDELDAQRPPVAASVEEVGDIDPAADAERERFAAELAARSARPLGVAAFAAALHGLLDDRAAADADDALARGWRAELVAGLGTPLHLEFALADAAFGERAGLEHATLWQHLERELRGGQHGRLAPGGLVTDRANHDPVDLERSAAAIGLLRRLVALAPEPFRPDLYAALGWLEWVRGGATLATRYARECLEREPDHPLAAEVELLCAFAVVPAWIGMTGVGGGLGEHDFERLLGTGPDLE